MYVLSEPLYNPPMDITDQLEYMENPQDEHIQKHLDRIDRFAMVMDAKFQIPNTSIRLGYDALFGFVPVIGDALMVFPQCFLLYEARKLGVSRFVMFRMGLNILIVWIFGSIPLLGEIFDIAFKSNLRNARLIRTYVEKQHRG